MYMLMFLSNIREAIIKMLKEELELIFATDEEGRYINLIIPANELFPEMNLSGKKPLELSIDEVVRIKKYAQELRLTNKDE